MNDVKIFSNEQFGQLRTVIIDGEPWFIAADVCRALEVLNSRDALSRLDDDEKGVALTDTLGGKQEMATVSEAGLYTLVLSSRKPEARQFKRWITHEVIPSIRKTGFYATPITIDSIIADPGSFLKLVEQYKKEKEANQVLTEQNQALAKVNVDQAKLIAKMEPESKYYQKVLRCQNAIPITIIAKDYGMSAKKMNKLLRDFGIQYKATKDTWVLYQQYADKGYTKTDTHYNEYGAFVHTKWTQTGREFIYKKLKNKGILPLYDTTGVDPTGDEDINYVDEFAVDPF